MRETPKVQKWVVYKSITGSKAGTNSVCTADEWKVVQERDPGENVIVQEDIVDESEAEKVARGTSGDLKTRPKAPRPTFR